MQVWIKVHLTAMDALHDFVQSHVDRLPEPLPTLYSYLPSYNTIQRIVLGIYNLSSNVPFLPGIITLLAVYIAVFTLFNTIRSAVRMSMTVSKYGAMLGLGMTAYNYFTGNQQAQGTGLMGQAQNLYNQFQGNNRGGSGGVPDMFGNTQTKRTTRSQSKKKRKESATSGGGGIDPVGLFKSYMRGDMADTVWDQVKDFVDDATAAPVDGKKARRGM